jgi:phosphosulfolactate synthase (CoM biosynthesis protein A)
MKRIYALLVMLAVSVAAFAQNGRSLYNKYSDYDNVEAVYISPAMFRLMGKIPDMELQEENVNLGPIIKSLTGLYILSTTREDIAADLAADVNHFIQRGSYELLMEAKDNGEVMRLYTVGDEQIVNSLVMLARDAAETSFICLDGTMPRDELETLIAEAAKD